VQAKVKNSQQQKNDKGPEQKKLRTAEETFKSSKPSLKPALGLQQIFSKFRD
jgi:hypothetical protein